MATRNFTLSVLAGATYRPLDGWEHQTARFGGRVVGLFNATAVGVTVRFQAGSDVLMEGPVPAGGVAGVIPSSLNVPVISDDVAAQDYIKLEFVNTTGGAITVNGAIEIVYG